jgi:hypothetical protein
MNNKSFQGGIFMSVRQLYKEKIKSLPAGERLELAKIILDDIPPESVIDFNTSWSDEDLRDATAYSMSLFHKNNEAGEAG